MMPALRLWLRLTRVQDDQRLTVALALIAFAAATGALLTVLGGYGAFSARDAAEIYQVLALVATAILVVPVITLGGAAARLAVARRDQRLSALRLAGATNSQVASMALADAVVQALAGALLGCLLYLAVLPGVAMVNFQGRPFRWAELWVGFPTLVGVVLGVTLLSVVSAGASLTRIVVSPLGVATRVTPKGLSWVRAAVVVVALGVWLSVAQKLDVEDIGGAVVVLAVCFWLINLIGPFVLGLAGRVAAHLAKDFPRLVAARRLIDDPKSAWRTVSGVAMATFVAGVLSVTPGLSKASGGIGVDHLSTDILTGAILTLVIAAILAAVSSGVTQAGRVLDLSREYRTLHLSGAEVNTLRWVQLREAWLPLRIAVSIAAGFALVMVLPLIRFVGVAMVPGLLLFAGGVVGSLLLVMGAVRLTQGLVDRVALDLAA